MSKKYPFYRQFDQMDCGPTCIRMISKFHGKSYDVRKIIKEFLIKMESIFNPDLPFHPGAILETEPEARNIKKSAFVLNIKMYPTHITDIIKGRRHVSATTALNFEKN